MEKKQTIDERVKYTQNAQNLGVRSYEKVGEKPFEISPCGTDIKILEKDCDFLNYLINGSRVHWRKEEKNGGFVPYEIDGKTLSNEEISEQKNT